MYGVRVIAVGGGAIKALNYVIENYTFSNEIKDLEYFAIDTDEDNLASSLAPIKIHIVGNILRAAHSSLNRISGEDQDWSSDFATLDKQLNNKTYPDYVVVLAALGGETGSLLAPLVAALSKKCGPLMLGMVTLPGENEGPTRQGRAEKAKHLLTGQVDSLLEIYCDRIAAQEESSTVNTHGAGCISVVAQALEAYLALILDIGVINGVHMYERVGHRGRLATVGIGKAIGENKYLGAVETAILSPILIAPLHRARDLVLYIRGDSAINLETVSEMAEYAWTTCSENSNFEFNCFFWDRDEVVVVLFGFGLESTE
ncbi:MAG: hypothetical protein ABRQ26_05695 [Syntrophomonadaceae bacterium]